MAFEVGGKVVVKDINFSATKKKYGFDPSMRKILNYDYVTIKNIRNECIDFREIGWSWHQDDFELYNEEKNYGIPFELYPEDCIRVLENTFLCGHLHKGTVLRNIGRDAYSYYIFTTVENVDGYPAIGQKWSIDELTLRNHFLKDRDIEIIPKQKNTTNSITNKTEKEVKMEPKDLTNSQKIVYSKLTPEEKKYWKAGLIDIHKNLTSDGKQLVEAYILDKYRDEALKSILSTVTAVDEE